MTNGEKKTFFRARYGIENGRLIKTYEWTGILEIDRATLIFRVLSSRQQNIRVSILGIFPLVIVFFTTITFWGWLTPYLFRIVPEAWLVVLAIIILAARIALLVLGILGLVYLLDFLTFSFQARISTQAEILKFKEIQMGRFRHIMMASRESKSSPTGQQQEDVVITVAATRSALSNALRHLQGYT